MSPSTQPTGDTQPPKFVCDACGAELKYVPGLQSLKCQFCGKTKQLLSDGDYIPDACESIVPIELSEKQLEFAALEYMALGKYVRDDVVETARITKIERKYYPCFRFSGSYEGTWSAAFGFDRQEPYTQWVRTPDGGRQAQTSYRTVTDWSPASGNLLGSFDLIGYGGSKLAPEVAAHIEASQSLDKATTEPADYTAGFEVESLQRKAADAFAASPKGRLDQIIEDDALSNAAGDHQRDWNFKTHHSYDTSTVLMPLCRVAVEYEDKEYCIWIDGTDKSRLKGDSLPEDQERKNATLAAFTPAAVSAAALLVTWLALGSSETSGYEISLGLGAFAAAVIYGLARRNSLLQYSTDLRSALLAFSKSVSDGYFATVRC